MRFWKLINGYFLNLVKHMGEKPCQCNDCGASYTHPNGLKQHKDKVHLKISIVCQICGGFFSTKRNLKRHIAQVHQGKKRKY